MAPQWKNKDRLATLGRYVLKEKGDWVEAVWDGTGESPAQDDDQPIPYYRMRGTICTGGQEQSGMFEIWTNKHLATIIATGTVGMTLRAEVIGAKPRQNGAPLPIYSYEWDEGDAEPQVKGKKRG